MTPADAKAMYRRQIDAHGEDVVFRRYTGTGASRPHTDVSAKARVMDYRAQELVGAIIQGDRRLIVIAEDLDAAPFSTVALRKGDKAVVRGDELNIEAVDDSTRRIAGTLIAYDLQVRG